MAIFSFSDLSSAYPTFYNGLRPQMQRKAPLLRYLPVRQCTTGDSARWLVSFDGQVAGNVNIDGGNFLTAAADPRVTASLAMGAYAAPVKVTTKAQWTGSAQNVQSSLFDMIGQNLMEALNKSVKLMNQDLFKGAGPGSNQITGLSSAIASTGTYATIAQSSNTNWAAITKSNSGTLRNVSASLIKSTTSAIAGVSPHGRPDFAVLGSALFDSLENVFDGTLYTQAGKADLQYGKVMTNGGQIVQATGFRTLYWASQQLTFLEDPDCTNTAQTNAANCIYFLNSNAVEIQYIAPTSVGQYVADQKSMQATEQDLGSLAGLQFDWRMRPRTQYADEGDITCMLNLVVKDRAACGLLADVQ